MLKTVPFDQLTGTTMGKYYLERFIGRSKIGPIFLIRADTTSYLLRFLDGPLNETPRDHAVYLEHFQYRASQIATLQHPHLLPLLNYGVFRGLPYLVTPHLPLRSLRTRLLKNGALDTFTVGRYLDQIATALEYAHEHAVLHGSLSVDSIFIRLDGNLLVADVGVRSLLEPSIHDMPGDQLLAWSEGYAPEQLSGKPSSPATDVYALGVVVYFLLTGSAVFEGSTPEELAQQHLYASVPPLTLRRRDLPVGLYSILARALAKDPAQRFHQPGAFANAYHSVMGVKNRTRVPFVVSAAPAVQGHQPSANGASTADILFTEPAWSDSRSVAADQPSGALKEAHQSSVPHSLQGFSDDALLSPTVSPRPALMRRFGWKYRQRAVLIVALVALLVMASSVLGITLLVQQSSAMARANGQVTFFANQNDPPGQTNALHITIQHLPTPPAGNDYEAWIINDQTEAVLGLGRLTEHGQTWSLTYSGSSSNLLTVGDKLEITQEQGVVAAPVGQVILTGTFPVMAFAHIQHLLVSFPETPGKVGMLIGLLQQTHLLDSQAAVLQSDATSRDTVAIECVTQSMLDIIEGVHGAHYQPLARTCSQQHVTVTGDGFGLLGKGYIAGAEEHASLALSQKDATSVMHQHAALMEIALSNVTGWVTTIEQDLLRLHGHPTDLSSLQEITTLADNAYHGVDVNGDGQIDPVPGEAGALTAYQQGQLMATLFLTPPH